MTPQPTTTSDATPETETGAGSDTGPCCTTVGHDLSEHTVEVDVRTLSAMGNETRYEVLRLLAATDAEVCSCDLAPELDVDQSTTSRALKALYEAGLVDRRKDGRWRYYTTTQRAETLLGAIDTSRGE
jgi:ArsR family transcriptional regulator